MSSKKKHEEDKLKVSEMFMSIQGEGPSTGVPAVFLRLSNCNLYCTWCDTLEVWKQGDWVEVDDLLKDWEEKKWLNGIRSGLIHLIVTGGEPLLQIFALRNLFQKIFEMEIYDENVEHVAPERKKYE